MRQLRICKIYIVFLIIHQTAIGFELEWFDKKNFTYFNSSKPSFVKLEYKKLKFVVFFYPNLFIQYCSNHKNKN